MDVALVPTVQIYEKSVSIIIVFVIGTLTIYINIHNRVAVLVGSFLTMVFALYVKKLANSLEYQSFRTQLSLLSGFATTSASILLLSVFARVFSDFVAESGVISIGALHKILILLIFAITIYGILVLHDLLWLYRIPFKTEQ